ncbi:MAG: hypothetical protein HYZ53_29375 [Planctomycetes bacterium]|nr:hypothetical protein [Planctomycetota bacterium]
MSQTLDQAARLRRNRIVITTFLVARDPTLQNFLERLTRVPRGRAYFSSPDDVGEFLFVDYLRNRRSRAQ